MSTLATSGVKYANMFTHFAPVKGFALLALNEIAVEGYIATTLDNILCFIWLFKSILFLTLGK